jgi:hypothetical protein
MQTDSPKSVTLACWDWTFDVFWCDTEASASVYFFASFSQKSVTFIFERRDAEALDEFGLRCLGFGEQAFP